MSPRRPAFVDAGAAVPRRALAVDGNVVGAIATYSHWQDAPPTPDELIDDTSTAILVRAAADPARWLDPYPTVAIDHVDADGVLSVVVACRPEVARDPARASLLIQAAECGDFSAWHGEAPYRLMLRIHQHIRAARVAGARAWEQRCLEQAVDRFDDLVDEAGRPDAERDAQTAWVVATRDRLTRRDGYSIEVVGDLARIGWTRRFGHADDFMVTRRDDDLPPHAMDGLVPATAFQLLSQRVDGGWIHQLDAPRHSWARTVCRPRVAWPDLAVLAERLSRGDEARWLTVPGSAAVGFTCILASVDDRGAPAASRRPPEDVAAAWTAR